MTTLDLNAGIRWLVLSPLMLLLVACGGGGGGGSSPSPAVPDDAGGGVVEACGLESQKAFVKELTDQWYLWIDEMADPDPADFDSAQAYLDAIVAPLAVDGRDPGFSYLTTRQEDEASFTTGAYIGFGFRFTLRDSALGDQFWFLDVLEGSPAGLAGLTRGMEVLAIDSGVGFESIGELSTRGASNEEIFGPSEVGVERGFRVRDGDQTFDVTLIKAELETPPLAGGPQLLERPGLSPVGYLNLRAFQDNATQPLIDASGLFAEAGVTDLVVDLRYNLGGSLAEADLMLDLIGGLIANGEESFRLAHNRLRAEAEDVSAFFAPVSVNGSSVSVSPLRIAFITTGSTASASELVINSMQPWLDVVLVGADTLGKAVGQYAFDQPDCDTRLRLVSFELVNGEGFGGWYNGLMDTGRFTLCPADDDFTRNFGDPEETSLSVALGWLNEGICGSTQTAGHQGTRQLFTSERPRTLAPSWDKGRSPWLQ